jgi:hypothetical protein
LKPIRNGVRILDSSSLVPVTTPAGRLSSLSDFSTGWSDAQLAAICSTGLLPGLDARTVAAPDLQEGWPPCQQQLPVLQTAPEGAPLARGRNQKCCMLARTEVPRRRADSSHVLEACQCLFSGGLQRSNSWPSWNGPPGRAERAAGGQGSNGYRPAHGSQSMGLWYPYRSAHRGRMMAMLAVCQCTKLRSPTGPISPAQNIPATGTPPPSAAWSGPMSPSAAP